MLLFAIASEAGRGPIVEAEFAYHLPPSSDSYEVGIYYLNKVDKKWKISKSLPLEYEAIPRAEWAKLDPNIQSGPIMKIEAELPYTTLAQFRISVVKVENPKKVFDGGYKVLPTLRYNLELYEVKFNTETCVANVLSGDCL